MDNSFTVFAVRESNRKLSKSISNVHEGLTNVVESESLFKVEGSLLNIFPNGISVCDTVLDGVLLIEKSEEDSLNNFSNLDGGSELSCKSCSCGHGNDLSNEFSELVEVIVFIVNNGS